MPETGTLFHESRTRGMTELSISSSRIRQNAGRERTFARILANAATAESRTAI